MSFLSGRCIGVLACTLALAGCIVATVPSTHTSPPAPPPPSPPARVQPVSIDEEYFYDSLDPYGEWVWVEPQGWVWAPGGVDPYWRPYTVGRWAWSDYGWTWVSDEPWGWAAYHYGRWTRAPRHGWVWVPGDVWGPAWVAWRQGPGVVGWAPLPPQVGFTAHGGLDFGGADINIAIHSSSWCFVDEVHIIEPVHHHLYPVGRNTTVIRRTTPHARIVYREGRVYNDGYSRERAEHALRRPLPRYRVVDGDERHEGRDEVRGNEVRVWRPKVRESSGRPDPQRRGLGKPRDKNLDHARETDKEPPRRQAPPTQAAPPQAPPPVPPQAERGRMERESERDPDQHQDMRRREASQKPKDPPSQPDAGSSKPTAERERNGNSQGTDSAPREQQQQPERERMERNTETEKAHKGQQAERAPTQKEAEKPQPPAKGPAGKAGGKAKGKGKKTAQESSSEKSEKEKTEQEKPQQEEPPEDKP